MYNICRSIPSLATLTNPHAFHVCDMGQRVCVCVNTLTLIHSVNFQRRTNPNTHLVDAHGEFEGGRRGRANTHTTHTQVDKSYTAVHRRSTENRTQTCWTINISIRPCACVCLCLRVFKAICVCVYAHVLIYAYRCVCVTCTPSHTHSPPATPAPKPKYMCCV